MKFDNKTLALSALLLGAATVVQAEGPKKPAAPVAAAAEAEVMCYGVNACKAQGSCHGKVDTCAGKNNCNTEVSCAGHNACKGKGLVKMSKNAQEELQGASEDEHDKELLKLSQEVQLPDQQKNNLLSH